KPPPLSVPSPPAQPATATRKRSWSTRTRWRTRRSARRWRAGMRGAGCWGVLWGLWGWVRAGCRRGFWRRMRCRGLVRLGEGEGGWREQEEGEGEGRS
ncbi:hypothetical protein FQN53_008247, partial [Emmonsiellopsis sp. PD_33]